MTRSDTTPTTAGHPAGTRRSLVWHVPASTTDDQAARAGDSWRTRCGIRSAPHDGPRVGRKARTLPPIERCVVCIELGRSGSK